MNSIRLTGIALIFGVTLLGCNKANEQVDTKVVDQNEESASRSNVDFGGVEIVTITAVGYGKSMSQAVDSALKSAIEQVNGKQINASNSSDSTSITYAIDESQLTLSASELNETIKSKTNGAVTGFKILEQKQVRRLKAISKVEFSDKQDESHSSSNSNFSANSSFGSASASNNNENKVGASDTQYKGSSTEYETVWEVKVEAKVAKYRESADAKRPRIVIAMPRSNAISYDIGGSVVGSDELGKLIKNRLSDAITQTSRFTVLDREFTDEVSKEMEFIESGKVKNEDYARIGQMLATDLIVIPKIDRFEYLKSERKMRVADRTIVSYSGGGSISIQVINAVTGQVVLSESYAAELPSTPPTTMGMGVDGGKLMNVLLDSISTELIRNVLVKTFPVAVINLNGTEVVLNQGGKSVIQGALYSAVKLGQEVVDPQTGQSLGKMDSPCCTIEITRIGPNMSYGRIVDEGFVFNGKFKPGVIELREQVEAKKTTADIEVKTADSSSQNNNIKKSKPTNQKSQKAATTTSSDDDGDW